jgi:hypothetical protein
MPQDCPSIFFKRTAIQSYRKLYVLPRRHGAAQALSDDENEKLRVLPSGPSVLLVMMSGPFPKPDRIQPILTPTADTNEPGILPFSG